MVYQSDDLHPELPEEFQELYPLYYVVARGFDNTLNAESKLDKELKELVRSCIIAKLVPFFVKGNHRARRRIAGVPLWGLRPCRYGGFRRGIASPPSL